jgi:tetratricopeptide (TPR) repeat protein
MIKRLFISYSTVDRAIADKVRDQLRAEGYDVWIAHEDIRGAVDWTQTILDTIDSRDGMVLVWSESAAESNVVREEIGIARVFLKPIFPIHAHPMKEVPSLPGEINSLQVIHMSSFDLNITDLKKRLSGFDKSSIKSPELAEHGFIPKAPHPYFVGRDRELKDLFVDSRGFRGTTRRGIPIAITGLAGIGKTQLALAFSYRFNLFFTEGVYWVDAASGIVHEFGKIGPHLGVKRLQDEHPNDYADRVLEKLRLLRNGLIIFDDVKNFSEFRQWCPTGNKSCSVILTTRLSPRGFPARVITLTELDSDSAYEMLIARRKDGAEINRDEEERRALKEICHLTGNHPLALELCASRLQSGYIKPTDYLQRLQPDALSRLSDETENDVFFGAGTSRLLDVLHDSYASLDQKLVDRYFLLMCCFASHGVNEELLVHAYGNSAEGREVLERLAAVSLIRREHPTTLVLHPLVTQFGRALQKTGNVDYPSKFVEVMLGFLRAHENNLASEEVRREKPHIDEALRVAQEHKLWEPWATLHEYEAVIESGIQEQIDSLDKAYQIIEQHLPGQKRKLPALRLRLGKAHRTAGRLREALADFNKAEVLYREIENIDPAEAASLRFELGDTRLALGQYAEAEKTLSDALNMALTDLDNYAPEVLQLRRALAEHALYLGNYDTAEAGFTDILGYREKFYTTQPDATSAAGLASAYADLSRLALARGHYADAIRAANDALTITKDYHNESDPEFSHLHLLLGTIYYESGDYGPAEEQLDKARRNLLTTFGEWHPNYARALIELGEVHRKQGKFDKAKAEVERAIEIFERVYGESHPSVAEALEVQGKIYDHLGEFEKEQVVWERILEIQRQFYSEQHPALATTHYDYASLFLRRGQYDKAAEHLQSSLRITEQSLGRTHAEYFGRLVRLATCRYEQQQYSLAQEILNDAKGLQNAIFGDSPHPYIARMLQLQSEILRRQGRFKDALVAIDQAIAMKKAIYGTEDHPSVAEALEVKVDLMLSQFQIQESSEILDTIERIRSKAYGISHLEYAHYQMRRAEWYEIAAWYDAASKILEQSLQTCLNVLSAEHPETLRRQIMLARMARTANDIVSAENRINGVRETLGTRLETEESLIVAETNQVLSYIRRAQGDYSGALAELEKALRIESKIFGSESPTVIELQNERARLLVVFHHLTEANDVIESALRNIDPDQPRYRLLKSDLLTQRGILQDHKKEYDRAIESIEEAIKLRKDLLGDDDVELARLYIEKAVVLRHQGKYDDALADLEEAQNIENLKLKDENHVYFARILLEQGQTYLAKKDYLSAQVHLKEALQIYDIKSNRNVKQRADAAEALGQVYLESGRSRDALEMFEEAMDIRMVIYGSSHPEIDETLHNQAKALLKMLEARENEDSKTKARQKLEQALNRLRQRDDDNAKLISDIEHALANL